MQSIAPQSVKQTEQLNPHNSQVEEGPVVLSAEQTEFIDRFMKIVPGVAMSIIGNSRVNPDEFEEAISDGYYGLVKAAINNDPDKAGETATNHRVYAEECIKGAVLNGLRTRKGREVTETKDSIVNNKISVVNGTADSLSVTTTKMPKQFKDPVADQIEAKLMLIEGLEKVDPLTREVFGMYYIQDISQPKIAAKIGCSQMQVSRILKKAQQAIKQGYLE